MLSCSCVYKSAIPPNFSSDKAIRICNISHFYHWIRELLEESNCIFCILVHELLCSHSKHTWVHFLVWVEQPLPFQQNTVEGIVQKVRGNIVHGWYVIVRSSNRWADGFQFAEVWIRDWKIMPWSCFHVSINPCSEIGTSCHAYSVCSCRLQWPKTTIAHMREYDDLIWFVKLKFLFWL